MLTNTEISQILRSVAAAYKIHGEDKNRFRIAAYERAADSVEHASSELKDVWDEGKLVDIAGIGPSIAEHLDELFKTGKSDHFEKVKDGIYPSVFELMKINGIGPRSANQLARDLGIKSAEDAVGRLKKAAKEGKIAGLENFGRESEQAILIATREYEEKPEDRMFINKAQMLADELIVWMRKSRVVKNADALGSLRRKSPTVGDIDIAVAASDPEGAIEHFTKYSKKSRVLERGDRTASILLAGNIQVDLIVERPESYGALLQHFTGSKHHNIALRELALKIGLSLSDYGIKKLGKAKIYEFETEEKLYSALGMDWIPPELREGAGELEAALQGTLPKLVEVSDMKGDLHMHSSFDIETSHVLGQSTIKEHAEKAKSLGYEYISLSEHNPSKSSHTKSEITTLIRAKRDEIAKVKSSVKIFNSLEIDILPDGGLPIADGAFEYLDFAICSIHSSFSQSKKEMTERVIRGLSHPKVKIFGHPTTRILNKREGIELDWERIFSFCTKNNKWLEINSSTSRLDLPDFLVREAVKAGVKLVVNTDSHHAQEMDNMRWGVAVARRGWAEKADIVNTLPMAQFENLL